MASGNRIINQKCVTTKDKQISIVEKVSNNNVYRNKQCGFCIHPILIISKFIRRYICIHPSLVISKFFHKDTSVILKFSHEISQELGYIKQIGLQEQYHSVENRRASVKP